MYENLEEVNGSCPTVGCEEKSRLAKIFDIDDATYRFFVFCPACKIRGSSATEACDAISCWNRRTNICQLDPDEEVKL
jgi:hypothetical protein